MFTLIKNQLTDSSQRHPSAKNVISFHLFFTSFFLALPSAVLYYKIQNWNSHVKFPRLLIRLEQGKQNIYHTNLGP